MTADNPVIRGRTQAANETALFQFVSGDGRRVVSVVKSGDNYRFVEDCLVVEPRTTTLDGYEYWSEVRRSGIYASLDAAKAAAEIEIPGLSWT